MVADAVRASALLANGCFRARRFHVETDSIGRRRVIFDPVHGLVQLGDDLVAPHQNDDVFRPEGDAGDAIADHVQVDELTGLGD